MFACVCAFVCSRFIFLGADEEEFSEVGIFADFEEDAPVEHDEFAHFFFSIQGVLQSWGVELPFSASYNAEHAREQFYKIVTKCPDLDLPQLQQNVLAVESKWLSQMRQFEKQVLRANSKPKDYHHHFELLQAPHLLFNIKESWILKYLEEVQEEFEQTKQDLDEDMLEQTPWINFHTHCEDAGIETVTSKLLHRYVRLNGSIHEVWMNTFLKLSEFS